MTNKSISQLTAGTNVASTDLFPDVQTVGVGPVKVTAAQIGEYVLSGSGLTGILPVARGGTGLSTMTAANNALYSTSSSTVAAGTLPTAAGGTGLTTFTAANNAIYSSSSSALTAGTLPVAAGGTGLTSLTAGYIPFGNGTSAFGNSANLFWDSANGRLGIGTSSPSVKLNIVGGQYGQDTNDDFGWVTRFAASSSGPAVFLQKSRSATIGTNTIVQPNDVLGTIVARGADGSNYIDAANIAFKVDGTPGTNDMPGRIEFSTTLDNYSGSSLRMTIKNNGYVGINSSSPSSWLYVQGGDGTGGISGPTSGTWAAKIVMNQDTSGYGGLSVQNRWANISTPIFECANGYNSSPSYNPVFQVMGDGTCLWKDKSGSEIMRVDNSSYVGNVGIGTSAPSSPLTIGYSGSGDSILVNSTTSAVVAKFNNTGGGFWYGIDSSTGGNFSGVAYGRIIYSSGAYPIITYTNSTERMRIDSSGNVGIGTSSPTAKLHVAQNVSATDLKITYQNQASNAATIMYLFAGLPAYNSIVNSDNSSNVNWQIGGSGTANVLNFNTNGSERLRIDSSGNVGIGTSSPTSPLTVYKGSASNTDINIGNSVNTYVIGVDASGNYYNYTNGAYKIYFSTSGSERFSIDSNGNVVVNTAAIATNATNGFLYIPTCAGAATGSATSYTGRAPMVVDSTNNRLYIRVGSTWKYATLN